MRDIELMLLMFFFLVLIPWYSAKGRQAFYVNLNGVKMGMEIYNKLVKLYSENFVRALNNVEYRMLCSNNFKNLSLKRLGVNFDVKNNYFNDCNDDVTMKLIRNGNYVTLLVIWDKGKIYRRKHIIGIAFNGSFKWKFSMFKQVYKIGNKTEISYISDNKLFKNGFGCSFEIYECDEMEVSLTFKILGKGAIYAICEYANIPIPNDVEINYYITSEFNNIIVLRNLVKRKFLTMGKMELLVDSDSK